MGFRCRVPSCQNAGMTRALLFASILALLAGCRTYSNLADPIVLVQTPQGTELGVSTTHGVAFLGRTAKAGRAELVVWFGDGPSIEPGLIEPIGGDLYTIDVPLKLPTVALSFRDPSDGEPVEIRGRGPSGPWKVDGRIVKLEGVEGILLEVQAPFDEASDQTGAGIFVLGDDGHSRLLGLLSGRLALIGEGPDRVVLTAVGPTDLWRLVAYRRDLREQEPAVRRPDLL